MTYQNSLLELIPFDIAYLLIGIAAIELLIVLLIIITLAKISKMKKNYNSFMEGSDAKSLEDLIHLEVESINALKDKQEYLDNKMNKINDSISGCYQKSAIVKYDAFSMGGQVSFAYCLLNQDNNGIIMNSIHTREGSYLYMKEIKNGTCDLILGKEEQQSLLEAMSK